MREIPQWLRAVTVEDYCAYTQWILAHAGLIAGFSPSGPSVVLGLLESIRETGNSMFKAGQTISEIATHTGRENLRSWLRQNVPQVDFDFVSESLAYYEEVSQETSLSE